MRSFFSGTKREVYTPSMLARDVQGAVRTVNMNLTVRLLVSGSGSGTSKLLGLVSSGISDQQRAVELDEDVLDLLLALLIDVLLVVGDQRLGQSLPDGVDLGDVATALHTDADIDISKPDMRTLLTSHIAKV